MKKLVGGVFLLSLLTLTLVQSVDGETYTSITDKDVLKQLTNLKSYIKNPEMIKPVWVQLENDGDIIVVQGQLSVVDDGEFDIDIAIKGYSLTIHVEFTQATLEDSTPIDDWYIDTNDAKYLFTSDAQNLAEQLSDFTGDVDITGDVEVDGDVKIFENIVDKDGHKRFIEGNITPATISGITYTFAKWSLSGSHLMIVVAMDIADETELTYVGQLCIINVPDWVLAKIVPNQSSSNTGVDFKTITLYASDNSKQNCDFLLRKNNENGLFITSTGGITLTADRSGRLVFDLLIDNE